MSFGISYSVKSRAVRVCTPELFRQAIHSRLVGEVCAAIEDALEKVRRGEMSREDFDTYKSEQKKRLPIFTPHATFRNGRRLNAEAIPSGHFERTVKHRTQELGIVLAHITPSTEGLRLFFVIPKGMDLAGAQAWMSRQLGDATYDQSVKDYARSSFVVPSAYILYIDEARLFSKDPQAGASVESGAPSQAGASVQAGASPQCEVLPGKPAEQARPSSQESASADGSPQGNPQAGAGVESGAPSQAEASVQAGASPQCEVLPGKPAEQARPSSQVSANAGLQDNPQAGAIVESGAPSQAEASSQTRSGASSKPENTQQTTSEIPQPESNHSSLLTFKGVPYARIIGEWFKLKGGEPVQGERNDKLHRLASHLRYITDNDEQTICHILPRYGLPDEEVRALVHSACTSRFCSMPKVMQTALRKAGVPMDESDKMTDEEVITAISLNGAEGEGEQSESLLPPEMPRNLPALIALLTSRTPDLYKPAVAHAVFPSLGAHLWRVRFRYIDNVEHEATLMNVLMAGTGAGKNCISEPINRIMADIRLRDEENLQREREWKNEVTLKGANKDRRKRPDGLVIQEIDADMTNPAFVMRTAEADGHFLYTKMNEIDQFDALKGGQGRAGQQFQIMCLSFDPNNRYGQTRVGAGSVTEKVTIRFNWNASTTVQKGQRYFSRVLTDGPISRINFCTIPEREIGSDMPVYGSYDAAFDEELRPYIENLTRASGLIVCPQAFRLANILRDENADFARLSQNRVYENLSFRANVIAYLKACVLYVANGCRWEPAMEDFIRWSLRYDLWCKMMFFGEAIAQANNQSVDKQCRRGPKSLLSLLPEQFTLADAARVRQANGLSAEGTRAMINQWIHRHYISRDKADSSLFWKDKKNGKEGVWS